MAATAPTPASPDERLELRLSPRALVGSAVCGLALCALAVVVPPGNGAVPFYLAAFGAALLVVAGSGVYRRRRPVVTLDSAGLRDERLREPRIPWSNLDVAYYKPAERAIRLRFRPDRGHSNEPASRVGALLPGLHSATLHAFHDGELSIPLRGLAFDGAALRRLLASRTRPHEPTPYAAQVAADSGAPR